MAAISAGTAAAISAGSAIVGTGVSAGMSFAQASKQKRLMNEANAKADQAMQEARKKLEVNVYASQGINKEPYERQREALLASGAQAIEAGVESERGAAATAGRVQMAQNEAQAQQAEAMNKDLMALEQQQLAEQSRLNDIGIQLDLGEVEGAQAAAANSQDMANKAMGEGAQGLVNLGKVVGAAAQDMSSVSDSSQAYKRLLSNAKEQGVSVSDLMNKIGGAGNVNGVDFGALNNMNPLDQAAFISRQSPSTINSLYSPLKLQNNSRLYNFFHW